MKFVLDLGFGLCLGFVQYGSAEGLGVEDLGRCLALTAEKGKCHVVVCRLRPWYGLGLWQKIGFSVWEFRV